MKNSNFKVPKYCSLLILTIVEVENAAKKNVPIYYVCFDMVCAKGFLSIRVVGLQMQKLIIIF